MHFFSNLSIYNLLLLFSHPTSPPFSPHLAIFLTPPPSRHLSQPPFELMLKITRGLIQLDDLSKYLRRPEPFHQCSCVYASHNNLLVNVTPRKPKGNKERPVLRTDR